MRVAVSAASVCHALVALHTATAIMSQPNSDPPGTDRRLRATAAAHTARPVEANSTNDWSEVCQNTGGLIINRSRAMPGDKAPFSKPLETVSPARFG
jgi:hypothetical protein